MKRRYEIQRDLWRMPDDVPKPRTMTDLEVATAAAQILGASLNEHMMGDDGVCWCAPRVEIMPNGNRHFVHNSKDEAN